MYLRFELIRGRLTADGYDKACAQVRESLQQAGKPHFDEFLQNWKAG